ncbi:hypothetical protein D3C75_908910 [compost metagenome]
MVDILAHNIQQLVFACRFIIRNRCFNKMPGNVQLMTVLKIGPALAWLLDCEIGIQIPVWVLRLAYQINDLIRPPLQLGIT